MCRQALDGWLPWRKERRPLARKLFVIVFILAVMLIIVLAAPGHPAKVPSSLPQALSAVPRPKAIPQSTDTMQKINRFDDLTCYIDCNETPRDLDLATDNRPRYVYQDPSSTVELDVSSASAYQSHYEWNNSRTCCKQLRMHFRRETQIPKFPAHVYEAPVNLAPVSSSTARTIVVITNLRVGP